jgi:hypothetical protein
MSKPTTKKSATKDGDPRQFAGVSVRTAGELDEQIDRVLGLLAKRSAGVTPSRASLARQALARGLDVIERELCA